MPGPNGNLDLSDITDDIIEDAAKDAARAAGEEVPEDPFNPDPQGEKKAAVDPTKVAAGEEEDKKVEKTETAEEKEAREKAEAEAEVYIPEEPKKKTEEPKKTETPATGSKANPEVENDELSEFKKKLEADGYDAESVENTLKAVELGGKLALKRIEDARAAEETKKQADDDAAKEVFSQRRHQEYVSIGNLQKDGRIPKVPVAIQKKLADGETLTKAEMDNPGVKLQNEVWGHMVKMNREAAERGEQPYLLNFRTALTDFELTKQSADETAAKKKDTDTRKQKSALFAGGSGGSGDDKKGKPVKPYVRGQSLDDVVADIMSDFS